MACVYGEGDEVPSSKIREDYIISIRGRGMDGFELRLVEARRVGWSRSYWLDRILS